MKKPVMPCEFSGLSICRSRVHGLGLFATRDFEEGEEIGVVEYAPVVYTSRSKLPYVIYDSNLKSFFEMTNCFKYLNYSANPNVSWLSNDIIIASRGICAGDELLWDYGDEWPEAGVT